MQHLPNGKYRRFTILYQVSKFFANPIALFDVFVGNADPKSGVRPATFAYDWGDKEQRMTFLSFSVIDMACI